MGSFNGRPALNGSVVTVTGNQGYTQYRPTASTTPGKLYDLRGGRWTMNNSKWMEPYYATVYPEPLTTEGACDDVNGPQTTLHYPVLIEDANQTTIQGGVISGIISTTSHWRRAYCNAAAVTAYHPVGPVIIEGVRANRVWDGIRIDTYLNNINHIIRDCWISDARDDAIELDGRSNILIQNCLLDRVFIGVSSQFESVTVRLYTNRVTLDRVIINIAEFPFRESYSDPVFTNMGNFFKFDNKSPALSLHNSIFACRSFRSFYYQSHMPNHWTAMVHGCSSPTNAFLWTADTDFPWVTGEAASAPWWPWAKTGANTLAQCRANSSLAGCQALPDCFSTILKNQAARDYLDAARTAWIAAHPDVGRIQALTTPTDASGGGQTVLADPAP